MIPKNCLKHLNSCKHGLFSIFRLLLLLLLNMSFESNLVTSLKTNIFNYSQLKVPLLLRRENNIGRLQEQYQDHHDLRNLYFTFSE